MQERFLTPSGIRNDMIKSFYYVICSHDWYKRVFTNVYSVETANYLLKPKRKVFDTRLENLKLPASSVLIFDDSYLNLEVAHKIGMSTVQVSNGIAEAPKFWEIHKKVFHDAPEFVDLSTHSIVQLLDELCTYL